MMARTGNKRQVINAFSPQANFPIMHLWQEDLGCRKTLILEIKQFLKRKENILFSLMVIVWCSLIL